MFKRLAARLSRRSRPTRWEAELDEEVRFHVEMEVQANIAWGMTPAEARRVALRDFGGATQTHEAVREVRAGWIDSVAQDVKYGVRSFGKHPGFTAVAILTLGLGIGANTAIFSLVDAILFRPLPFADPGRLVWVMGYHARSGTLAATIRTQAFEEIRRHHQGFDRVSCSSWMGPSFTSTDASRDVILDAYAVCTDLIDLLGVRLPLGRSFLADEGYKGSDGVAVISHEAWQGHFGGDQTVVGRTVSFKERSIRIVGVLPPGFVLPPMLGFAQPDMLVPATEPGPIALARLKRGVSIAQAEAELDGLDRGLLQASGTTRPWERRMRVVPLQEGIFKGLRPLSYTLFGAAALVLLLAVVNLANLLMARGSWRSRELAIRVAIGAGRRRLIRQLLVEGVLLSAAGGALGLGVAWSSFGALLTLVPSKLFTVLPAGVDRRVLLFALGVSVLTGLAAAVLPAVRLTKPDLTWAFQEAGRQGNSRRARTFRGAALVAVQMALVVVLLTAAGLMLNSLIRALTVDLGVHAGNVVRIGASPPRGTARSPAGTATFFRELMLTVAASPAVTNVAGVCTLTLGGVAMPYDAMLRDGPPERRGRRYLVTAEYFRVLGIAVRKGRVFTNQEVEGSALVAVVNETAARQLWPGQEAVGQRFQTGTEPAREVIGVVSDTQDTYRRPVEPALYLPPDPAKPVYMDILASTDGDVSALETTLRQRVAAQAPAGPPRVEALATLIGRTTVGERFQALLLSVFAGLALLLAAVGIFGIAAYTVARRTREIGIRLALGSTPLQVGTLVVRQSLLPVVVGALAGMAGAVGVTRLLTTLLFQVKPADPPTFLAAVGSLILVAALASLLPARRASRVDPIEALRVE